MNPESATTSNMRHAIPAFASLILALAPCHATAGLHQVGAADPSGVWLTRGNGVWHTGLSFSAGWRTLDDSFAETAVVHTPLGDSRGLDYDPVNNRMVRLRYESQAIEFYSLDGAFLDSIPTASRGNDISVDPRDGSIWEATFNGAVRHYNSDGMLLNSFDAGFFLTGIAIDSVNDTLLLLRAESVGAVVGPLDDELYEFSTDGNNLGRLWDSSVIEGNGVGLEYIPEKGLLYVTAFLHVTPRYGAYSVTIFSDPSRVPGSSAISLLGVCMLTATQRFAWRKAPPPP